MGTTVCTHRGCALGKRALVMVWGVGVGVFLNGESVSTQHGTDRDWCAPDSFFRRFLLLFLHPFFSGLAIVCAVFVHSHWRSLPMLQKQMGEDISM